MLSQGKRFLNERKYEEAIDMLSTYLQTKISEHGEMDIQTAEAYFEYGNALLMKEEETPTDDLLGAAAAEAKIAASTLTKILSGGKEGDDADKEGDDDGDDDGDDGDDGDDDGEGDEGDDGDDNEDDDGANEDDNGALPTEAQIAAAEGGEDDEDNVDDLQVAWELLEVARQIYEANATAENDLKLTKVYVRLGDLQKFNGLFQEAVAEYERGLELSESTLPSTNRQISDLHFSLAVAHLYKASEDQDADTKRKGKSEALVHYKKAKESIEGRLQALKAEGLDAYIARQPAISSSAPPAAASSSSSAPSSSSSTAASSERETMQQRYGAEIHDASEVIDELAEAIDALEQEIHDEDINGPSTSSGASGSGGIPFGVTTIGFGAPAQSSSSNSSSSMAIKSSAKSASSSMDARMGAGMKSSASSAFAGASHASGGSSGSTANFFAGAASGPTSSFFSKAATSSAGSSGGNGFSFSGKPAAASESSATSAPAFGFGSTNTSAPTTSSASAAAAAAAAAPVMVVKKKVKPVSEDTAKAEAEAEGEKPRDDMKENSECDNTKRQRVA